MEIYDLERGNTDLIQKCVRNLLHCVGNEDDNKDQYFSLKISMAPIALRNVSPSSFNPRMVSIGPLHRDDENVQAFEKLKPTYLSKLLNRIDVSKAEVLKSCMQKVDASMERIKASYVWTKTYDDAKIAEMMVTDACFILELMWQVCNSEWQYSRDRLVFQNVICDLVLLENQIPFFILDEIFQCTILKFEPNTTILKYILPILRYHKLFEANIQTDHISTNTTLHILGLLHQLYTPPENIHTGKAEDSDIIPSAVDLDRSGVIFKPNQNPTWVMGMEVKTYSFMWCLWVLWFWFKPTLSMPVFKVHDHTEFVLRNLIAYEHSFHTPCYITSYALFMDSLVDSQKDVAKLVDSKVLINLIGSNEEAANMINNVCKEVAITKFFYSQDWKKLNEYYNGVWPKHIAWLKRTYFNNPWNIIALLAGIILFALTVVQTIFTINPV